MDASAMEIGGWMVACGSAAVIANQVLKLVDRMKEKPAPSDTYLTKEAARMQQEAITQRLGRVDSDMAELRGMLLQLGKDDELRSSKIHDRIDKLGELISKALGKLNM